jgi:hypothetical protein
MLIDPTLSGNKLQVKVSPSCFKLVDFEPRRIVLAKKPNFL